MISGYNNKWNIVLGKIIQDFVGFAYNSFGDFGSKKEITSMKNQINFMLNCVVEDKFKIIKEILASANSFCCTDGIFMTQMRIGKEKDFDHAAKLA